MAYQVVDPSLFDGAPELGMGYHFGVLLETGEGFIVLNAQIAVRPHEIWDPHIFRRIRESKTGKDLEEAGVKKANVVVSNDVSLFLKFFERWLSNLPAYRARSKLHESPPFPLAIKPGDKFVRFSAFAADRRIGPRNSLRPGTYATSDNDAFLARTGYGNVGRYALPNLMSAHYRFDITVPVGTVGLLVGTVAPAFGQAGGGVEIEFTSGGPPGSVVGPSTIPEY